MADASLPVVARDRDFTSELFKFILDDDLCPAWIRDSRPYTECAYFAQPVPFAQLRAEVPSENWLIKGLIEPIFNRRKIDGVPIPGLAQIHAEHLLCVFQEILPYLLKPSTPELTEASRKAIFADLSFAAGSPFYAPQVVGWLLSKRYEADLLRSGQVRLIEVAFRALIAEARCLIRNAAGGEEILESLWQDYELIVFLVEGRFRSERLEVSIWKYLEEREPVNLALVGAIRERTVKVELIRAHLNQSTRGSKGATRDIHIMHHRYDEKVLSELQQLLALSDASSPNHESYSTYQLRRKEYLNNLAGESCFDRKP
ncbi:hypothetical protein BJ508DRAFT_418146 [Ascobolus immersus RN42]|uniref:Uncharacterized protein n=1 Tax=Ascobolus immersus RN42 TaxID=1160509 RepID=A0A3N4HTT2_ASCIM|nr:hypothetical protein BJ508DRAFT_418146 [Ascobolus immersus RN42]